MCITFEIAPHLEDKHLPFTQSLLQVWKSLLVSASNILFNVMFIAHPFAELIYAARKKSRGLGYGDHGGQGHF